MPPSILTLFENPPHISIVDVGASPIEENQRYDKLLESGVARVIGFEPNPAQFEALRLNQDENHIYLPYALGDGSSATLNIYRAAGMTSVFETDMAILGQFNHFEDWCVLVGQEEIKTKRLDDVETFEQIDFLKIDVQGSELKVLENGLDKLQYTLVIQIEAAFFPLYKNQPVFADIDNFLRKHGFFLHTFERILNRAFKPIISRKDPNGGLNQVFEIDAVYVRKFTEFDRLSPLALTKIAVIAHELYGSYDLASLALKHADIASGTSLQQKYLKSLKKE